MAYPAEVPFMACSLHFGVFDFLESPVDTVYEIRDIRDDVHRLVFKNRLMIR